MKGIHDFDEWYKLQQQKLKEDPIASYLIGSAELIVHEGEYAIYTPSFFSSSRGALFFNTILGKISLRYPKNI
jgi:hypothetical protein